MNQATEEIVASNKSQKVFLTDLFNHFKDNRKLASDKFGERNRLESLKLNDTGNIGHKLSIAKIFDESTNFAPGTTDVKDKKSNEAVAAASNVPQISAT